MSEMKKPINPAKEFLFKYYDAKIERLSYMAGGRDSYEVHAADVAKCEDTMRRVDAVIKTIENPFHREILRLRYECNWPWRRIIYEMEKHGYCEGICYKMHGRALQRVNEIISEMKK